MKEIVFSERGGGTGSGILEMNFGGGSVNVVRPIFTAYGVIRVPMWLVMDQGDYLTLYWAPGSGAVLGVLVSGADLTL